MTEPVAAEQVERVDWRHLLTMLAMVAVAFLAQPGPASAQVQTYSYQGQAFDNSQSQTLTGLTSPPCFGGGSINSSVRPCCTDRQLGGEDIRGPFLTLGSHRAVQSQPRSPSSHPEAAAQSDELGCL
jgi:hypothetical protein